jgi:hypothetical protein
VDEAALSCCFFRHLSCLFCFFSAFFSSVRYRWFLVAKFRIAMNIGRW